MEEEAWKRHHGGGILEEESWRRNLGRGILEEESWRRYLEASGRHLGGIWEASGRVIWEASGGLELPGVPEEDRRGCDKKVDVCLLPFAFCYNSFALVLEG